VLPLLVIPIDAFDKIEVSSPVIPARDAGISFHFMTVSFQRPFLVISAPMVSFQFGIQPSRNPIENAVF
jgi:hypothetical protein